MNPVEFRYGPDSDGHSGTLTLVREPDGCLVICFSDKADPLDWAARCTKDQGIGLLYITRALLAGTSKCEFVHCVDNRDSEHAMIMIHCCYAPQGRFVEMEYVSGREGLVKLDLSRGELESFGHALASIVEN